MDYLTNCVFVGEAAFNTNTRVSYGHSVSGTPAIVETPSICAISHTILEAVTSHGVVSAEVREPLKPKRIKVVSGRKRRNVS
jgi:hypothetical protein